MKWQFYRLAVSLFLSCLLLFWSFGAWIDAYEAKHDSYTVSATQFFKATQPSRQLVPRKLLQLPASLDQQLDAGEVIALQSSNLDWYYYKASEQADQLWRFGPLAEPEAENHDSTLILLIFYACLMLLSAGMLYPLFRDLYHLQQKAGRFMAAPMQMQQSIGKSSPIYPLARDFVDAGNQLVRWYELHQFLSRAISHDVRTPLARMRFALELCQDEMPYNYWQRLQTDIQQIEQLVSNYLNFSRMEQQRQPPTLQYLELTTFAAGLQQQFQWRPSKVSLHFEISNVYARFDPKSLEIAWQNLLSNALRYAKQQVRCSLYCDEHWLYLVVEDDGTGFPDGVTPAAFVQFDCDTASGYGLGLSIVNQVVQWHQGQLKIDRSPAMGGAAVTLMLPLSEH